LDRLRKLVIPKTVVIRLGISFEYPSVYYRETAKITSKRLAIKRCVQFIAILNAVSGFEELV
jgi:hypothetical protein